MKKSYIMNFQERLEYFDLQRKNYPTRREFNNYTINSKFMNEEVKISLKNYALICLSALCAFLYIKEKGFTQRK